MTNRRGFTLVETVMAMVIAGIIFAVFAAAINSGLGAWFFTKDQTSMMLESRSVMKRLVREIRRTRDRTSDGIMVFNASRYQFKDVDNNTIDYQQSGANLTRNGAVLLNNLAVPSGLQFTYLNTSGQPTLSRTAIRTVNIIILVESSANRVRLQSAAGIRNR